ncbi:hypothetical protein BGZ68_000168 [Mortierella alpina]|nr:hypothetical protein BGZ68_000168 [Mortierella alpina]
MKWGLSGFGPRHALYLIHQAIIILVYRKILDSCGIKLLLKYTVYEKQEQGTAGFGHAWYERCDAAANTIVTKAPTIPGFSKASHLGQIADLSTAVSNELNKETNQHIKDLEARNPAAAILFKKALNDNTANMDVPCTTRGQWGRIQQESIRNAVKYIQDNVKEIEIDIKYSHKVIGVNFKDPRKPILHVRNFLKAKDTEHPYDFVSFAHGTPLVSPVNDQATARAFTDIPNHEFLKKYLQSRGVLDDRNKLLPETKIACTGLSLSFYDYASLLLPFLPCFKLADNAEGFEIDKSLIPGYEGLLTVISRSSRGPAPPRIALNHKWRGDDKLFFSTKDMHMLRLQRNENWLPIAYKFLEAHIARSVNKVPKQVNYHKDVGAYMASYREDNIKSLSGVKTNIETDLLRAGYVAFSLGNGLSKAPSDDEKKLVEMAPHTRAGRAGFPMFCSGSVEISSLKNYNTDANTEFFRRWEDGLLFHAASPVVIQNVMASLFTFGIAKHMKGSFDDIHASTVDDKLLFEGHRFDALLAAKKIDQSPDHALVVTKDQVKEIITGVPDYGKGGYFQTKGGKPIHAFDGGLGGWGMTVRPDGKPRVVGAQWKGITNSHYTASEWATSRAYHTLALALAPIALEEKSKSPLEDVSEIYNAILPDAKEFAQEVEKFRPQWEDLQERILFLDLAATLAKDDTALYKDITNYISTAKERETRLASLLQSAMDANDNGKIAAFKDYHQKHQKVKAYDPPSREEFERRFADYTVTQHISILEHILAKLPVDKSKAMPCSADGIVRQLRVGGPGAPPSLEETRHEWEYDHDFMDVFG